ncbi:LytR/AlgR family response regulator transcription factor [Pedobacter punctiformis]|uniref:LytTR family DNA-binding domain-containing protein n=1 Tax=Pedobacter punctiformis TaxID=3004097 RepID=A0ABT4LFD3_9SPHI|nr:LytTR family DNA-binding domain-containing protein [Pedobacter sp. HCMS5-2]MCZ4245853.1 LytTR family DNA-binding domain-containing protein [Pedobacter sp. HCMS5-2]
MEKLNCVIIDDEPLARDVVESFAKSVPFLNISATFEDPVEALLYIRNNSVDIVFSDIEMPKLNGLEFVRALGNVVVTIFITAYRDFALDGFETGATDYLVKPVRFDRFLKAVNKAKDYLELKKSLSIQQVNNDRIFIKSEGKLIKILLNEILYIEAQGDYLKIVIPSATYTTQTTLKSMEEMLSLPNFFRIQRSFILNLEAVRSVNGNMVELVNGKSISIALNKKEEFFNLLGIN